MVDVGGIDVGKLQEKLRIYQITPFSGDEAKLKAAEIGLRYHWRRIEEAMAKGISPSRADLNQYQRYAEEIQALADSFLEKLKACQG